MKVIRSIAWMLVVTFSFQASGISSAWANVTQPQGAPKESESNTASPLPAPPCPGDRNDNKPDVDPVLLTGGKLYLPYIDVEISRAGSSKRFES